jgi:hypothetical protein
LSFCSVVADFTVIAAGANGGGLTGSRVISMALHSVYAPVLPEMDPFLFASVGEEIAGIPLSVVSALAQLDLDPRSEAARLSNLTREAAATQLGRLFARLPDRRWTSSEIRRIASTLVELLPTAQNGGEKNNPITSPKTSPIASGHLIYLALALALSGALAFLILQGFVASDNRDPDSPVPLVNSLFQSNPIR